MTKRDSTAAGTRLHMHQGQLMLSLPVDENFLIEAAKQLVNDRFNRLSEPLDNPDKVRDFLLLHMASSERELLKR